MSKRRDGLGLRVGGAAVAAFMLLGAYAGAQTPEAVPAPGPPVTPVRMPRQPDAEDALATLVKRAGIMFAGEVYAIRMPGPPSAAGTTGGGAASPKNVIEIEFRVDQGIRGTQLGTVYVLKEWSGLWQNRPAPFQLHERAVVFLYPPNQAGLSSPVGGDSGVLPIDGNYNVELAKLHALVQPPVQAVPAQNPAGATTVGESATAPPPVVTDVTTAAGEQTLLSGSDEGRMDDLRQQTVPFLAFLRDLYVLSAAEAPAATGSAADKTPHDESAPPARAVQ